MVTKRTNDGPPEWSVIHSLTNIHPDTLQTMYREVLEGGNLAPAVTSAPIAGEKIAHELTVVPKVLSVTVTAQLSGGENWKALLEFTPKVFETPLDTSSFELSRLNSHITIHPGMAVAKADLTIGLTGPELWFGVTGKACYFGHEGDSWLSGWGWVCGEIHEPKLFAFHS
ncbi:hypothetical protein [Streptomyces celluloflavus]|uniref:hypothetical protein n=1 Tax=Streptomyces celluloflavus TaxID=58344 RepID=UPI00364FF3FE